MTDPDPRTPRPPDAADLSGLVVAVLGGLLGHAGHPERPPVGADDHHVLIAVPALGAAVAVFWLGHGPHSCPTTPGNAHRTPAW